MKPLLIPYAIDSNNNRRITSDEIATNMEDIRSTIRLQATATKDTGSRKRLLLTCPKCCGALYPHAPRTSGRYFWSHRPKAKEVRCPLESKRRLTPNDVNAIIFKGRQEGVGHRELVDLLCRLALQDPAIDAASLTKGAYEPPSGDMRNEGEFGRYPDVQFMLGQTKVILEAQLATITLHGINGRRAFYDRLGARLLWIMRHFDPSGALRASIRDIVADQAGVLFSVDKDVEDVCSNERRFYLRAWQIEQSKEGSKFWISSMVTIHQAIALATPRRWADDFKRRWIVAYRGRSYFRDGVCDRVAMLNEIAEQIEEPAFENWDLIDSLLSIIRILISLEVGFVTGTDDREILSLANHFHLHKENYRAVSLVERAVENFQPDLLKRKSMQDALAKARARLQVAKSSEWGQKSLIGRIRNVLFPDWEL